MPVFEAHSNTLDGVREVLRLFMLVHPERAGGFDYRNPNYAQDMSEEHCMHHGRWLRVSLPFFISCGSI
jgi:hypothetical protein